MRLARVILVSGVLFACGDHSPQAIESGRWPPDVERNTKMQSSLSSGDIPADDEPTNCICDLEDITSSAKLDCFFGRCTQCRDIHQCDHACWEAWREYMEGE